MNKPITPTRKKAPAFVTVTTTILLAATLIALGFFVCSGSTQISRYLSERFSPFEQSPFTQAEIADMAEVTHDYTVGSHDLRAINDKLIEINQAAQQRSNTATLYGTPDLPDESASDTEIAQALNNASDVYVLDAEAISHLDDVYEVTKLARMILCIVAILALIGLVCLRVFGSRRQVSRCLLVAGCTVLGILAIFALWIVVDFNGFFAWFHSLFFAEGTWTFSSKSLLITMYPTEFWISMGAIWLTVTVLGCLLCIAYGTILRKGTSFV